MKLFYPGRWFISSQGVNTAIFSSRGGGSGILGLIFFFLAVGILSRSNLSAGRIIEDEL